MERGGQTRQEQTRQGETKRQRRQRQRRRQRRQRRQRRSWPILSKVINNDSLERLVLQPEFRDGDSYQETVIKFKMSLRVCFLWSSYQRNARQRR